MIRAVLLLLLALAGCVTPRQQASACRPFEFEKDTFAFPNELVWVYEYDSHGKWTTHDREPPPTYWQHCFVLAKATKQFFFNARFDPTMAVADEETYRRLIRRVVLSSPRHSEKNKIVIPGYANLRQFSQAHEAVLKQNCGGAWQSYFQRGHWRMIFPFSRHHQARMARRLVEELQTKQPVLVHVVRFPQLTINHAVVLFDAKEDEDKILFSIYDPNQPSSPRTITYDKATSTFLFEPNNYFPGGRVDVYEIFRGLLY